MCILTHDVDILTHDVDILTHDVDQQNKGLHVY